MGPSEQLLWGQPCDVVASHPGKSVVGSMPGLCNVSCYFFKQETLIHIVSLQSGVKMPTGEPLDFPSTGAL